jgi:hypothetical protein
MLIIVSPAKTLDFESALPPLAATQPQFRTDAARLVRELRGLDAAALAALLHISPDLAALNVARFRRWSTRPAVSRLRPAVRAFRGDVYLGMRAEEFGDRELAFAQQHLRILSGLYGVLRPLDLIQPYRLEMGTPLATARGRNLYAFWGERIARALRAEADALGTATLVNLASQEYFHAVDTAALGLRVVTPLFKERRGGALKIISFSAKRARGAMAGLAIRAGLREPEALRALQPEGYRFHAELSHADEWVFVR